MPAQPNSRFLLASSSAPLASAVQTALFESSVRVEVAWSAHELLNALRSPGLPCLLLLDADLPDMNIDQVLAVAHIGSEPGAFPVVLISHDVPPEWIDRLGEGALKDVIPPNLSPSHLRVRLDSVLRAFRCGRELQRLREAAALNPRTDLLTGLHNRTALLELLFTETDRVQRMNTSLCVMLFSVDHFAQCHPRLGQTGGEELLRQVVERVRRLLRSYDLFGRLGGREFALALPGCNLGNAVSLAERIRGVFSDPFRVSGASLQVTTGFGIASSDGRSPVVVLREAELALRAAQAAGPNLIRTRSQPDLLPLLFSVGRDDIASPTHT